MEQRKVTQNESNLLVQDIFRILHSLNSKFPKLVGDIILTLQEDMKDSSFVQQVLSSVKNEVSEENKQHMSHECMPPEENSFHLGIAMDSLAGIDIRKELARPEFTLKEENDSECLPCGDVPNIPIAIGFLGESSKKHAEFMRTTQIIKDSVYELTDYQMRLEKNREAFKDELKVVNLILDFVDGHCV